jgi:mannose-6-phosphate isomerase
VRPLVLEANQLHRFYRGGAAIAEFRGIESSDDRAPEDWVGATSTTFGAECEGLTRLEDGRLLRDAVRAEPEAFLGAEHLARFGADPALLVKLLDAGERLPVHFHPGRPFARRYLGSEHGKTEAWVIIEAQPDASVHVGFRDDVDRHTLGAWVREQNVDALLGSLHEMPVSAGDVVFVTAGTAHAIGEGILMVEVQEPTDFSILLEIPAGEDLMPELGLGWELALEALDRAAFSEQQLHTLPAAPGQARPGVSPLLPDAAQPFFRAERIVPNPSAELDPGYCILVVTEGEGQIELAGGRWPLRRGQTLLIPHSAGPAQVQGNVVAVRCRPADPAHAREDDAL